MSAQVGKSYAEAKNDSEYWGRLVETCVGAYLLNSIVGSNFKLNYWRYNNYEVDFVLSFRDKIVAIEIKSGLSKKVLSGMEKFRELFNPHKCLIVGQSGIDLETFLQTPIAEWFE